MPDDQSASAAATLDRPAPAADATPAAPQEQPEAAQAPDAAASPAVVEQDWRTALDSAPVEELRTHPRFAGIVGQMVDQAVRRAQSRQQEEMTARARAAAEAEMAKLAEADPYAFAQKYLSETQAKQAQAKLEQAQADLAAQQASRFATAIGNALKDVPEWKEMSEAEFEALAKEVGQDNDPEVVFKKFLPKAIAKIADKRTKKDYEARFAKELKEAVDKEVEARVKERLAERRQANRRPDLARPAAAETNVLAQVEQMSPKDFNAWYEENVLGPSR